MAGDIALFALAERRLGWIDARQRALAQNIANADTPGYQPRDIAPFASDLNRAILAPSMTSPLHLAGGLGALLPVRFTPSERAPDGNAVGLEDQLTKVADDETQQALVGNLWKTYMGMFMTALGKTG